MVVALEGENFVARANWSGLETEMKNMHIAGTGKKRRLGHKNTSPLGRMLLMIPLLLTCFLLLTTLGPAHAQTPAPWPDAGSANPQTGWTPYTYIGQPIRDRPSGTDTSTGGTTPTQSADIVALNNVPSTYFAYDTIRKVLFVRMQLANTPLTPTPDGNSNDDPWDNVTWSLLIDTDGDGFKEVAVQLQGDSGGPANPIDDIAVYYDNSPQNSLPTGAVPIYRVDSAVFPNRDTRPGYQDFARSRAIAPSVTGGGWFLDWQVPLSGFNGFITETTPISFAYGTSNSNTDPLQKDVAFNGDYVASPTAQFPFGDVLTLSQGISQAPIIRQVTATGSASCGPATLTARVTDTLIVTSGASASSIANVRWFYQPDSNADGAPDAGSTATLIGQANAPTASDITVFQLAWNNTSVPNGTYVIYAVATDQQGNTANSLTASPPAVAVYSQSCGTSITGRIYGDANRNSLLDGGETGTGTTGLFVKLIPSSGGNALQAVPVDPATGTYSIAASTGSYTLILDNNNVLTDTTSFLPSGFIGTEAPTQTRTGVTVGTASLTSGQNFGLFNGSRVSGNIFNDNGAGGGVARDGIRNGTEAALIGVTVQATNAAGSVVYDSGVTDATGNYTLFIPASAGNTQVRIAETNLSRYISTGGQAGTTGGTYSINTDVVTFTNSVGTSYTGVNFADLAAAQLQPVKSANPLGSVVAGQTITYTISIPNTGSANSSGTTLQDAIPAGTTYVAGSTTLNGAVLADAAGGVMPFTTTRTVNSQGVPAGQINIDATATVTFQVVVNASPPTSITNTATIDVDGAGPSPVQTAAATNGVALLQPTKTSTPSGALTAGQTVTYTIAIPNIGTGSSAGTTLTDIIPAGTSYVQGSTTLNGIAVADNGGVMPFATARQVNSVGAPTGQIAAGASATVSFRVLVNSVPPDNITNTATVNVDGSGPSPVQTATASNGVARLAPTKVSSVNGSVVAGQTITYTISIPNTGSANSSGTTLQDVIPTGTTYVAGSTTLNGAVLADAAGGVMPFTTTRTVNSQGAPAGQISAGASTVVMFQVRVNTPAPSNVTNTATIDVDGAGPSPIQTVTASNSVVQLNATKTANPAGTVTPGQVVTYTVSVANTGNGNSTGTTLADPVPVGATYVAGSSLVNGVSVADGPGGTMPFATATLLNSQGRPTGQINAGETATLSFQVIVSDNPPAVLNNAATIDPDGVGPLAAQNVTTSNAVARASVTKTASPTGTVTRASTITYTVVVTNTGSGTSSGTTLQDVIPAGTTYIPGTTTLNGSPIGDNGGAMPFAQERLINSATGSAGQLVAGQSATVTFQVTVDDSGLGSITNTAIADIDGSGAAPSQRSTTTNPVARLIVSKVSNPAGPAVGGEVITYTVTAQNVGTGTSNGATLGDPIPAGTTYVPGSTTLNGSPVADNGGNMPFATAALINNVGSAAGQVAGGTTATVTFQVRANTPAPAVITNTATVDVDGAGPAPARTATISNPSTLADLSVTIADGKTIVTPGSPLSYVVTLNNSGPNAVNSLRLDVSLPSSLTNVTFTPSQGTYNSATGVLSGINLPPGGSVTVTVNGTVSTSAASQLTTTVRVLPPVGVGDPNINNNVATDTNAVGVSVSGRVYNDINHNNLLDATEPGIGVAGLFAKIIPAGGTSALQAAPIDPSTGNYSFSGIPEGTYSVILDNNNSLGDVTASTPAGFVATDVSNEVLLNVVVGPNDVASQNIGLFNGSRVSGLIFIDNGAGGGIANNGVREGGETGMGGVSVQASNTARTTIYDATTTSATGSYTLYIPAAAGNTQVLIAESNTAGFVSVGGRAGATGGIYDRNTDVVTFTNNVGTVYSGVTFADVPANTFVPDQQKTALSGSVVLYPHVFTAGSAGTVSFSTTEVSNPPNSGWTSVLYRDFNGNGVLDTTGPTPDVPLTSPVNVFAGENVAIVVAQNVPSNAPVGAQNSTTVTATFTYSNAAPALTSSISRSDVTTSASSGLELTKVVDKASARSGEIITYTVAYKNVSAEALNTLVISDTIPAFTTFLSASTGAFPTNLTGVTLTQPAVGSPGTIKWTFTGSLAPGSTGTVGFQVIVR